jgi:hypothetical protein
LDEELSNESICDNCNGTGIIKKWIYYLNHDYK